MKRSGGQKRPPLLLYRQADQARSASFAGNGRGGELLRVWLDVRGVGPERSVCHGRRHFRSGQSCRSPAVTGLSEGSARREALRDAQASVARNPARQARQRRDLPARCRQVRRAGCHRSAERHYCRQMLDRGLSPSGLPLKRGYRRKHACRALISAAASAGEMFRHSASIRACAPGSGATSAGSTGTGPTVEIAHTHVVPSARGNNSGVRISPLASRYSSCKATSVSVRW
jgi:hypothetical protein